MVAQGEKLKASNEITALNQLSVYDIDIFRSFFDSLESVTKISFAQASKENPDQLRSFRIVADHIRSALFLVKE